MFPPSELVSIHSTSLLSPSLLLFSLNWQLDFHGYWIAAFFNLNGNHICGLLICTLISENQGLEKSRSASNLRKISGPANLDFFFLEKKLDLYHIPEKNPGVQDQKFLVFDSMTPIINSTKVYLKMANLRTCRNRK